MVNFAITDDSEKKPQRRNRSRRRRFRGQAEDRQPGNSVDLQTAGHKHENVYMH